MWETPGELKRQYNAKEIDSAEYLVKLEGLQRRRYEAAKDACPYMHPRLASVEQKKPDEHAEWLAFLEEEEGLVKK
jgi:hypothetical protein